MMKKIATKKKTGKVTLDTKTHPVKRKVRARGAAYPKPYTLEPHPEL